MVCLNVVEHVGDPVAQGRLLLYVPQKQSRYSSLDEALGRRCRYDRRQLERELAEAGLTLDGCRDFHRAGVPGWWWTGKILRRRRFSRGQLSCSISRCPCCGASTACCHGADSACSRCHRPPSARRCPSRGAEAVCGA